MNELKTRRIKIDEMNTGGRKIEQQDNNISIHGYIKRDLQWRKVKRERIKKSLEKTAEVIT